MDPSVIAAMAKWPNVPDCRGWLSLDRRGQWRLQGSVVRHVGLAKFIGRNYACDETGAWFMQNGPQRVWVELEMTPWVFRLGDTGGFVTHTDQPAGALQAAWLVDSESLCLRTEFGFGLVDDRDLLAMLGHLRHADGTPAEDIGRTPLLLDLLGRQLSIHGCDATDLETIGGYRRCP